MRIVAIECRRYAFPLNPPFHAAWDPVPRDRLEATIVFVDTDEGLTGVGSGDTMDGFERYQHLFVGEDPLAIERHVRILETIAFHAGRYWPLEAALWDIAGKAAGRSVAALLGATTEHLPAYASLGTLRPPPAAADAARALAEEGFRALKLRFHADRVEEGVAAARAVREALGDDVAIMVDLNQGWRMPGDLSPPLDPFTVRRVAGALAELGVLWLEEPLPAPEVHGLAALRRGARVAIAGGEMARSAAELLAYLEAGALDVYQPDAVLAVGILRARELAKRVLAERLWFTPHTWTNGIGLVANLHLAAGAGAGPFVEFPYDPPAWTPERRDAMLAEPVRVDDGCVAVPDSPGLGLVLDEDRLAAHRVA